MNEIVIEATSLCDWPASVLPLALSAIFGAIWFNADVHVRHQKTSALEWYCRRVVREWQQDHTGAAGVLISGEAGFEGRVSHELKQGNCSCERNHPQYFKYIENSKFCIIRTIIFFSIYSIECLDIQNVYYYLYLSVSFHHLNREQLSNN